MDGWMDRGKVSVLVYVCSWIEWMDGWMDGLGFHTGVEVGVLEMVMFRVELCMYCWIAW